MVSPRSILSTSLLAFLVVLAAMASSAAGAEEPAVPPVPFAFKVTGTNGYSGWVMAGARPGKPGSVILSLARGGESVTYATRAEVTETSIEASFGALGEIDVHSVPSGRTVIERGPCGSRAKVGSGRWEGTIRFRGEGGFTSVKATSATATARPFLRELCVAPLNEGTGGRSPGALLTLSRHHGTESVAMSVRKNKRVGPTRIKVEQSERRDGLEVERTVSVVDPSKAFDFEAPPGRVTVEPPRPFTGSLTVSRRPNSPPSVKGDLKVDLPGRAAVPLLGPGSLHASLVRAVLNPSHPF
jgi:hypothetical protein